MTVQTGQAVAHVFTVSDPSTGAQSDADALPTATLYVDGAPSGATVTITDLAGTGKYAFSVTMPTLAAGQQVAVVVDAEITGLACTGLVWEDQAGASSLTVSEVWTYGSRTLTQPLPSEEEQETEQAIRIVRGLTYQHTWSDVELPAGWTKVIWTLKDRSYYLSTDDASAKAKVVLSNLADETDGLTILAGAEGEAEQGSLVYDEGAGTLSLELADGATSALAVANSDKYDIKVLKDDDRSERLVLGDAVVAPTVTLET